jgi:LPXTG-motif cell wall-anchored protein
MRKYNNLFIITLIIYLFVLFDSQLFAMGILPKPPVKKPPVINNPPPSAPEPLSLTLIGMGASGVAGYYLGRRKKK